MTDVTRLRSRARRWLVLRPSLNPALRWRMMQLSFGIIPSMDFQLLARKASPTMGHPAVKGSGKLQSQHFKNWSPVSRAADPCSLIPVRPVSYTGPWSLLPVFKSSRSRSATAGPPNPAARPRRRSGYSWRPGRRRAECWWAREPRCRFRRSSCPATGPSARGSP